MVGTRVAAGDVKAFEQLRPELTIEPLPNFGRKFDLITAFATAFHGSLEHAWRWGEKEWDFFLSDLESRLKPGGQIFFDLNAAYGGEYYTPKILEVFLQHEAVIERGNVLVSMENVDRSQQARICA